MKSGYEIFKRSRGRSAGCSWLTVCLTFGLVIAAGKAVGLLTQACLFVIVAYALLGGVLPWFRYMDELAEDVNVGGDEHDDLSESDSNQIDVLVTQDASEAGSVHKLVKTLAVSKGRASKAEAADTFLACFDEHWIPRIEGLNDVAAHCPSLGIAGTMLGLADIAAVLEANGGNEGVGAAIATMSLTTLAGGACFVVISGLARRAANAVASHRKDLKYVSTMFQRGDQTIPASKKRSTNPLSLIHI